MDASIRREVPRERTSFAAGSGPALAASEHRSVPSAPWTAVASRWLRRMHLYSGIAMLPFVLVFAVSAFLFNHAGDTAAVERLAVPAEASRVLPADAEALAAEVARALGLEGTPADARLDGAWQFEARGGERSSRLSLAADGSSATLRANAGPGGGATKTLDAAVLAAPHTAAEAAARSVLAAAGHAEAKLRRVNAPTLRFRDGATDVAVALDRGTVTTRAASDFDLGRLLMRLHTTHGYQSSHVGRIAWAVIVDVMAAAMVLWAFSGAVMWWQKRSHRRPGSWVLAAAVGACVALAVSLHAVFTR